MYYRIIAMKKPLTVLIAMFFCFATYAQSADVITDILESDTATFGQICYLAAVQQNIVKETSSYEDAVQAMYENSLIPSVEDADAPIPAVDIAYIYSKLWPISGGLMYRLTKGSPRYAFKQFQADGIISTEMEPSKFVTGAKALSIYTSCINKYSDFDMRTVSMEVE